MLVASLYIFRGGPIQSDDRIELEHDQVMEESIVILLKWIAATIQAYCYSRLLRSGADKDA